MVIEEIRSLIARHAREDMKTPIEGVLISRTVHSESAPAMTGSIMALIAQGRKRIGLGNRVYEYGEGQYLVASVDLPVTGHFVRATEKSPSLGFGLMLEPQAIAELLLAAPTGAIKSAGAGAPPGMLVSDAPIVLLDAVVRLLRLLDTPHDLPVLAPAIKREILWRLILGEQGTTVQQLGLAGSHLSQIARTTQWIRQNYAEVLRVADLAALAGMSSSAFYRNFQAVTAMSPIQFQKRIRLQEARLLLAAHPNDVTSIGHRVGYDSASQFSREYRRQFSRAPSEDAILLRNTAPAALTALA
ncbi:MAG TPA: AraC family transcriptional regulator [Verrucomicrobiae bacterium]|nr:AraC family transcriptional regulator [Verrucomicrobiae bacterium]